MWCAREVSHHLHHSLAFLHHSIVFLSQLGYLDLISTNYMCCRSLTSFNYFFKPIRISWSNFCQLHALMLTLRTHDSMIFGKMIGKLASENFFWKWISRGRRKWWNKCSKLSLSRLKENNQKCNHNFHNDLLYYLDKLLSQFTYWSLVSYVQLVKLLLKIT